MKSLTSSLSGLFLTSVACVLMLSLIAYAKSDPVAQANEGVRKLRLSLIPPTGTRKTLQEGQPLVSYLEKETGAKVEITIGGPGSPYAAYAEFIKGMANNDVDIANLGGLETVQALARIGAKVLVQREEDRNVHTILITQPQLRINNFKDLSGHSFAFGEVNSVTGHLMPEYYMREAKTDMKVIEKALHTDGHEATVLAVANKKVDAGAVNPTRLQAMIRAGSVADRQVRVFWDSPAFVSDAWVARKNLDPKLAESFVNAILKLDAKNPEHKAILDFLSATKYVRTQSSDYEQLRKVARADGLLK